MATFLDSLFRPLAKDLLRQFCGTAALYRTDPAATNDPTDAEVVPTPLGPYTVRVTPFASYAIRRGDSERGTASSEAGFSCLVAATDPALPSGVPPDRGWELRDGARVHFVEEVHPIKSGDLVTAYRLVFLGSGAVP